MEGQKLSAKVLEAWRSWKEDGGCEQGIKKGTQVNLLCIINNISTVFDNF